MNYTYQGNTFSIERYPTTDNKSLKAWSAADEHILNFLEESKIATKKTVVYNDRFGFLSTFIAQNKPTVVLDFKSQEKAFKLNFKTNELSFDVQTRLISLLNLQFTIPIPEMLSPFSIPPSFNGYGNGLIFP